ncbi:MAG: HlyD family efflux transporter periplasmic adaptor subunit [Anaerolineae bacterium]|jgi:HlyD family secretion protein|nr:HlyD family efflux transporter periplasmic adaptor subunit [Anaerolineae bacterium]MBT3713060.1 HlyD family efflux transporter periplasmic adaptor subunit [Anaerolineae bacterium]MBT4309683.1 HlyD family efflux transporter periplasmic adaptor subunit [Anaerolineae bacterium]MBT4459423.1 HlyD family efflux transporter periplasmic adaptor subunit [Anaerolineae bacterium]MBT4842023.1 HlyD family efflux transporter periplasmic adaptor subunit [Anaerolineae bacterium]
MKKTNLLILLSLALILTLSACATEETPVPEPAEIQSLDYVVAEGHILPMQDVRLSFSARGTVEEILVEEGEKVAKDQVIIRLADSEQAEASLRAAELALITAQDAYDDFARTGGLATANAWQAYMDAQIIRAEAEREWEKVDVDNLEDDIEDAHADLNDFEEDLQDAQDDFDKYADLDEDNSKRKDAEDDLEDAQEDVNEAMRDLEETIRDLDEARADLDAALGAESEAKHTYESRSDDGLATDTKIFLESQLLNAKAQVDAAAKALANYELKAPFDGTVTDINVEVGQLIGGEIWAAQLADFTEFYIETSDLTELEVVKVYEGQAVAVVPDALPELVLDGYVESIGQSSKTQAGDIVYTVNISLNEFDPALRWGMTVEATFLAE